MYVTATSPYLFMLALLIRNSLLPGAREGVIFYLKPDLSKLGDMEVVHVVIATIMPWTCFLVIIKHSNILNTLIKKLFLLFIFLSYELKTQLSFFDRYLSVFLIGCHRCKIFVVFIELQSKPNANLCKWRAYVFPMRENSGILKIGFQHWKIFFYEPQTRTQRANFSQTWLKVF